MLSLRERAFRNVIFVSALALFLVLVVCFAYVLEKMVLSILGAFLLVIAIFLLIVTIDSWRKSKENDRPFLDIRNHGMCIWHFISPRMKLYRTSIPVEIPLSCNPFLL